MIDHVLTRPGSDISYSSEGDRGADLPAVVSAHGMSSSRANDELLGVAFESFPGRTVVRYDARGHGRSTGRPIPGDYAWHALADDLLALIDEISPDAPVDAIGASMGCGTILHAVLRAPERFRRLVLVIPPTAWETRAMQVAGYQTMAGVVEQKGVAAFSDLAAGFGNPPAVPADLVLAPDVAEQLLPAVFRGAALSDLPDPRELAGVEQPALILAWAGDPGHPMSTSEKLVAVLPQAELRVAQSPQDVAEWVGLADEFLGRQG